MPSSGSFSKNVPLLWKVVDSFMMLVLFLLSSVLPFCITHLSVPIVLSAICPGAPTSILYVLSVLCHTCPGVLLVCNWSWVTFVLSSVLVSPLLSLLNALAPLLFCIVCPDVHSFFCCLPDVPTVFFFVFPCLSLVLDIIYPGVSSIPSFILQLNSVALEQQAKTKQSKGKKKKKRTKKKKTPRKEAGKLKFNVVIGMKLS